MYFYSFLSLLLPIEQPITWSYFDKTLRFWRINWVLRVHMYLLSWRKTNFFCIISILSRRYMYDKCKLPKFYWLPKLHKRPNKSRLISNTSHCSSTILFKHITSTLTSFSIHVIMYSETSFSDSNVKYSLSIKSLQKSSKICNCVAFRVLQNHLSTFCVACEA